MTPRLRTNLKAAALLVALYAALGAGYKFLLFPTPRGPELFADIARPERIVRGQAVMYRGVQIGEVDSIAFVANGVRVGFKLASSTVRVHTGDFARTRQLSVLGDYVIDIVPGSLGAPVAGSGAILVDSASLPAQPRTTHGVGGGSAISAAR